ncbi:MFS general substrate transporter [Rickenella mellea]|uniref:MFS general substrate transporter n=1 Tax=Rickenella mellea TaxID=50990 RepID=A0A4Y7PQF4_9AGAM|nr:MFS general substrate transporter [Rickenella mellea]
MASLTPRMSNLWASGYFQHRGERGGGDNDLDDSEDDLEQQEMSMSVQLMDGRTPLDRTIDRIGMGSYQWTLLALCGFGWMADNMWIQTIAIILPRVQQHYAVPDGYIGYLSSSMFFGMMIGAIGWGSCSDLLGRSMAFNLTLFFTSVFGVLASLSPSYPWLCVALFFLGTSVGGSMPTDGTLLLEHMPDGKQYLVTALSVFFSFGAVASAVVGIVVIPGHSCDPSGLSSEVVGGRAVGCEAKDNYGWKYLLMTVGFITLGMFLARIVFFTLHESPRFLVHAGRLEEALVSLRKISKFNGSELDLDIEDVDDSPPVGGGGPCSPAEVGGEGVGGARGEGREGGGDAEEGVPFLVKSAGGGGRMDVRNVLFDVGKEPVDGVLDETEPLTSASGSGSASASTSPPGGTGIFGALSGQSEDKDGVHANSPNSNASPERGGVLDYDSTGESRTPLDAHTFHTPTAEARRMLFPTSTSTSLPPHPPPPLTPSSAAPASPSALGPTTPTFPPPPLSPSTLNIVNIRTNTIASPQSLTPRPALSPEPKTATLPRPPARPLNQPPNSSSSLYSLTHSHPPSYSPHSHSHSQRPSQQQQRRRSSYASVRSRRSAYWWKVPRWVRRPLWAWLDRIGRVLEEEWRRTTILVWAMWGSMSLAYTMFNVFLPKMLEMRSGVLDESPKSLEQTMWDIVIFTIGGCPGAILGAYLVESSLGRRLSLAGSTFVTAAFCLVFVFSESSFAVRVSTIGISLSATTMWAVLYGWTPEIFDTEVRGTACGTASALSRIGGMIAPVLGGVLLVLDRSFPVYTSVVIFAVAGVCTLLLTDVEGRRKGNCEERERVAIVH